MKSSWPLMSPLMYGELQVSSLHTVDAARINPTSRPPMPRRDGILLLFMMHLPICLCKSSKNVASQGSRITAGPILKLFDGRNFAEYCRPYRRRRRKFLGVGTGREPRSFSTLVDFTAAHASQGLDIRVLCTFALTQDEGADTC